MTEYLVRWRERVETTVYVNADSPAEAIEKARRSDYIEVLDTEFMGNRVAFKAWENDS